MQAMSDRLKGVGKALVMDPERTKDPVEFVQRLLQVAAGLVGWVGGADDGMRGRRGGEDAAWLWGRVFRSL
jgi:hypothetical protein